MNLQRKSTKRKPEAFKPSVTKGFADWIEKQCSEGMMSLHALARGDEYAIGEEHVYYDSPRVMMETESKPWFARWSRDEYQKQNGKLWEAKKESGL